MRALGAAGEWRGVIDFLLAVIAPAWRSRILDHYRERGPRLIEVVDWSVVEALDVEMARAVEELAALYKAYCAEGWREGQAGTEFDELTMAGIELFVRPRVPAPPAQRRVEIAA